MADTDDMADTEDTAAAPAGDPEPTNGFDGETITLGYLTDESGPLAILGGPLAEGSQVYWDYVNEELGGIAGQYQVELAVGDTKDDQGAAVTEYQRLKEDAVLFAQILSTPPTQAVLEFLNEDNIVGVPGSLAGAWASEANLLPNGAAYENEMINIADWYVNDSGLGSADSVQCAVSVDDLYGEAGLAGLEYAAGELGFELAESQTFARGDTDFSSTIAALSGAGCEAVYAITVPTEQNAMMAEAVEHRFRPRLARGAPVVPQPVLRWEPGAVRELLHQPRHPRLQRHDLPGHGGLQRTVRHVRRGRPQLVPPQRLLPADQRAGPAGEGRRAG